MGSTDEKTSIIAAEAAEQYYAYEEREHDCFLGSRNVLQAIIQTAIEKATEQIRKQMDFLAKDLSASRAAHASEPTPATDDAKRLALMVLQSNLYREPEIRDWVNNILAAMSQTKEKE